MKNHCGLLIISLFFTFLFVSETKANVNDEKLIQPKVINRELFGKYLVGYDGRRKLDPLIGYPPSKRMRSPWGKVGLACMHYLDGVESPTDFKEMYTGMQKNISKSCGTRSAVDKRFLKTSSSRFFKPT